MTPEDRIREALPDLRARLKDLNRYRRDSDAAEAELAAVAVRLLEALVADQPFAPLLPLMKEAYERAEPMREQMAAKQEEVNDWWDQSTRLYTQAMRERYLAAAERLG